MNQACRRLKEKLENHQLVEKVVPCFDYLTVTWKSGIKEKLIIHRFNSDRYRDRYRRSKIRPQFMPPARWWEDISNGKEISSHYLKNAEFEDDIEKYSNLVNWKWSDFEEAKFYERLLLIHKVLQYIIDNGWKEERFPENSLRQSLQLLYDENMSNYKYKRRRGFRLRSFAGKERPGELLIKHFMPYGLYGRDDPSFLMDCSSYRNRRRVYLAINNLITNNFKSRKKGKKTFLDINYRNILKMMRNQERSMPVIPYRIKQIGLIRALIEELELQHKTFYDVNPEMGEFCLAAHITECPYYYREAAPFDVHGPEMAKFLDASCNVDKEGAIYDFGIYHELPFNYELAEDAWSILKNKVELAIIFVSNEYMDEWKANHPQHHDSIELKTHRVTKKCGRFMLYYP